MSKVQQVARMRYSPGSGQVNSPVLGHIPTRLVNYKGGCAEREKKVLPLPMLTVQPLKVR